MRWSLVAALAFLISIVMWAPAAMADAIGGYPLKCPPGSRQTADHCGQWCAPTTCTSDADCKPKRRGKKEPPALACRSVGLCVEKDNYDSCSGWSPGRPQKRSIARDVCNKASDCIRPASCETIKRCVLAHSPEVPAQDAPAEPAASPEAGNCGCRLLGGRGRHRSDGAALLLLLLSLAGLRRAARSKPSRASLTT